jgi:hypothetical protein
VFEDGDRAAVVDGAAAQRVPRPRRVGSGDDQGNLF